MTPPDRFRTPEETLGRIASTAWLPNRPAGALDSFYERRSAANGAPLGFLGGAFRSLEEWRPRALEAFEGALCRPREVRLKDAERLAGRRDGPVWKEEWRLHTSGGFAIPATVWKPGEGRHPAVIALHDMSGMRLFGREKLCPFPGEPGYLTEARREAYDGLPLAQSLVERGYLVIAIDAWGFGQRVADWQGCGEPFARRDALSPAEARAATLRIIEKEWAAVRGAFLAGTTWAGMIAQDDLLSVEFLRSRDDVDPARIGCTGLSFGAYRAHYLAALDSGIKAVASVCWHSSLAGILGYNVEGAIGSFTLLPGLYGRMDLSDLAALAAPRPLLAISGIRDRLMQPSGAVEAHRNLRGVWQKAGVPDRFGSLFFDTGHQYGREAQEAALSWFDRHLR